MSGRPDIRENARDEERRRRDEARIVALQQQIDELRALVRELTARQTRGDELFKSYEMALGQVRSGVEQQRHDTAQTFQARQLDDQRLRQQVADLESRIDEAGRPLRSIQAHVNELSETLRRGKEDAGKDERRFDELRTQIDHLGALAERNAGLVHSTREVIESLRTGMDEIRRDLHQAEDSVKIAEQDFRRRIAEMSQDAHNLAARLDELPPLFEQHEALINEVRGSIVHIDPALEELRSNDERLHEAITRFAGQADERDDLNAQRIDDVRRQVETQVRDLRETSDLRVERLGQRLESLGDIDRELAYRISVLELRIEETRELSSRLRREVWHLHEQRSRMRLEQAQAEMQAVADARRAVEQDSTGERPERQGSGV